MPQYLAPGVYVEEVPSSVQPIAGVGTSTAGFIGEVADDVEMPAQPGKFVSDSLGRPIKDSLGNVTPIYYEVAEAGVPQLITSWESFKNHFGDFHDGNSNLAHAVYGFFNNGGTRCWVARIDGPAEAENTTAVTDALAAFEAIDEIALVAVPGATDAEIHSAVIAHCERVGDRFAILDGQVVDEFTPDDIQGETGNSDYAALYYPRIEVFDPVAKERIFVAPSGHIAGIYARIDTERGVHKAPANAVVRGALGLEYRLSRADQEGLNPAGINVIRDLNGNIVVWGARTLGGDANLEWKYINVRRLFLFLRESIDEGTQWVVFEPNDTALWAKITRNVTAFLTNVWRSGALFGNTPAEAFYVRCDASTNPPEVRDLGQVVCEIGVAVVRPAEFVIFRISQWAGPGK
ncbi:MAG TPA: phage tail sheath subtilisin-like domain-containing protein [Thermoanaerobaculia bacterium]|nr:phage tail sheath subtilisin-like domain-containing protein [Thermoanaerobaculia bacterium]